VLFQTFKRLAKDMNEKAIESNLKLCQKWKKRIHDPRNWHGALDHFQCVCCGSYCTYGNFKFFDKNPEKVLCYECQKRSKS